MGDIYLELIVANINDPAVQQEVAFLVDTGNEKRKTKNEEPY